MFIIYIFIIESKIGKDEMLKKLTLLFALLVLSSASVALASDSHHAKPSACGMKQEHTAQKDIVDTALSNPDFSTLVTALKAAGLVNALKADTPFTVFAPTNEAFAKLPQGVLQDLLKPENKEKLKSILTYHVVSGQVESKAITSQKANVTTLQGSTLEAVRYPSGAISIDNATVIIPDVKASNGVIHVIDEVILPE